MAVSTEAIAAESAVAGAIGAEYEIKYGFHVAEDYFFKSGRGLSHDLQEGAVLTGPTDDLPDHGVVIDDEDSEEWASLTGVHG